MTIMDARVISDGHFSSLIENGYYNYASTNSREGYVEGVNAEKPELTINNGFFSGGINTIKNDDGGVLNIAGGTFENVTQACIQNHNVAIIDGGIFNAIRGDSIFYAIDNCGCAAGTDEGDLTINGGTFSGYFFIDADDIVGTVVINGGTFSEYLIQNYNGNATVTKAADVKLSAPIGYSWNDAGKLAINQYKVTYLVNGEAVGEVEEYDYKSEVSVRKSLEETGYTITQWSTDDVEVADGKFTVGASDITFKATKTPNKYGYTVNYLDKDGNVLAEAVKGTADYGSTIDAPLAAVTGYTAPEAQSLTISAVESENIVNYTYTVNQYKVIYLTVDAAVLSEVTVDYGSSVTAPADPVRGYNYAFDGWLLDGKACTFPFTMPAEDLSIVASWEIIVPAADTETNKISVDADEYGAQFSSDSMQTIVDSATSDENVTLSVSIGDGISVVFDNAALRNFGNGAAELTVGSVAAEDMSDALKSLVGDGAVYTISFGSNTNFGDGTATVTLPFALSDGQNESDMYIAYIVDGKVAEKFDCTYSDGAVTFATGHFSTYAIMFDDSSDDGSFAFALIVAIVIVALVLAAVFLAGRSKSA